MLLARRLNTLMHTTMWTPWNVRQIPTDDLLELEDWMRYAEELEPNG